MASINIGGANMLIAVAFFCLTTAQDCEREAVVRAIVGQGATPMGCLVDGQQGAAASGLFDAREGYTLHIRCLPKSVDTANR